MLSRLFLVTLTVIFSFNLVYSQDSWESVPIDQWKKDQVKQILNDSAWAQKFSVQYNFRNILNGETKVKVLLRSALPVRLAMLIERRLKKKYDKMDKADKAEFDKKNADLLACSFCIQYYAISIISDNMPLSTTFVNSKKEFIYLENDQGVKRELELFVAEAGMDKNEQIYFFLRKDKDGNELFTKETKTFSFNLDFRAGDDVREYPVQKVSFNVSEITRENQILF